MLLTVPVLCLLMFVVPISAQTDDGAARLPTIDRVHEHFVSVDVDGVVLSDGSIHVTITETDGTAIFQSDFPVVKPDGRYLEWEYRGLQHYSMSRRVDRLTMRTLEEMVHSAKDIVRAIKRGHISNGKWVLKTNDQYGCDWPFDDLSCTTRGNCCDTHDACFETFGCNALSWLGLQSVICEGCNIALAACVATGEGSNNLPSECCAARVCGQERVPPLGWGWHPPIFNPFEPPDGGSGGSPIYGTPWGEVEIVGESYHECIVNGIRIPCF
ncbi:MAG TPA: hypothetical protein VK648_04915 [Gemmatimonadaceae bacterium]|nr:hypothetical protein [Gemmatimonadaceae bacterium]